MNIPGNHPTNGQAVTPGHREIHLKDLAVVVIRHWLLVLVLAALVGGGAYYSGRRAIPQFQSTLKVQVNSPKQVFARLDDIDVDELALRTDPILSEALVLTTQGLAQRVVAQENLQLELSDLGEFRGEIFSSIAIDTATAVPAPYRLAMTPTEYQLQDVASNVIASGTYADPIEGPGFVLMPIPPESPRTVDFRIQTVVEAAAWVSAGLSYEVQDGTNAVNIWFTGTDPTIVPFVLNSAATQLAQMGARRAKEVAVTRKVYIEDQLEIANVAYQGKLRELQAFKEGENITDLSAQATAVVQAIQSAEQQRQQLLLQISTLREAMLFGDSLGVEALNRLAAIEGISNNTALSFRISGLLQLYEERRTLTAGALGLRENNPRVAAIDDRIRQGHSSMQGAVAATVANLETRLEAIEQDIQEERSQLGAFPGMETRIAQLTLEADILNQTYTYLLGQLQSASMQEATISAYINILDGASPPYMIGTTLRQKVVLGVLVGLLLGLAGAFFLEYLDQTVKTSADIERLLGVPVLGMIPHDPKLNPRSNGRRAPIVAINQLDSDDPAVESYRALRTNVTFVGAEKPLQFVAVTSPGPREGKSTTAINLSVTLAQSGRRTILIDGDLRRSQVHRAFGLVQEPGLTDVLIGNASASEGIRPDVAPNLDMLPSGSTPPNPSELLGSAAMDALIAELRHDYEFIIMDTPPTLPVTDAAVVATVADATILVVRSGDTEESAASRAMDQLRRVRARIAGAVLNDVSQKRDPQYTYYSYRREPPTRGGLKTIGSRVANLL